MVNNSFLMKISTSTQNANKSNGGLLSYCGKKRLYFYQNPEFHVTQPLSVSLAIGLCVVRKKREMR